MTLSKKAMNMAPGPREIWSDEAGRSPFLKYCYLMKKIQSQSQRACTLPEDLTQATLHSAQSLPPLPDLGFSEGEGGSVDIQSWECLGLGELSYFGIVYIWSLPDLWSQKNTHMLEIHPSYSLLGFFFISFSFFFFLDGKKVC